MKQFDYNTANYQPKFNDTFGSFCCVLEESDEW